MVTLLLYLHKGELNWQIEVVFSLTKNKVQFFFFFLVPLLQLIISHSFIRKNICIRVVRPGHINEFIKESTR